MGECGFSDSEAVGLCGGLVVNGLWRVKRTVGFFECANLAAEALGEDEEAMLRVWIVVELVDEEVELGWLLPDVSKGQDEGCFGFCFEGFEDGLLIGVGGVWMKGDQLFAVRRRDVAEDVR